MTGSAQYVWELSRAALSDKDGHVIVLKIFMDESGTHDGSPAVAAAAYFSQPKVWRSFTTEFNAIKRHAGKRPIEIYHATDAEALRGEFKGWTSEERNSFVAKLLPAIANRDLIGVGIGIDRNAFQHAFEGRDDLKAMLRDPYLLCFQLVIEEVLFAVEHFGSNERLAFIHEENEYQTMALQAFSAAKARRKYHKGPMSITFATKKDFTPLQAADILAFETNKRMRNMNRPSRKSLAVMDPSHKKIRMHGFGPENMGKLVSRLDVMAEELKVFGKAVDLLKA